MKAGKSRLILYSRESCHLCDDMLAALETLRGEHGFGFAVDVVDIDADPSLLAHYDELVPVLVVRAPDNTYRKLCHYFLDESAVLACLSESAFDLEGDPDPIGSNG